MKIPHLHLIRPFTLLALLLAAPVFTVTPMVTTGYDHTVALKSDGTIAAWGDNAHRQLGIGNTEYRLSQMAIPEFTQVKVSRLDITERRVQPLLH
ncbi:MAG: hypothetical protein E6Q60_10800 [Nitrosomonas oligotropha]|uniref:Regulator of chromosome condensation (RCC1) repeat-containing protein n=1 Tax=Nitrosomonas oligotropha TaxID=42354 RepID=A0A5C7VPE4_9PROT|nr:MAG: hypothetical protein E6Q60_10800 [Nitrosomonas oligotropha]